MVPRNNSNTNRLHSCFVQGSPPGVVMDLFSRGSVYCKSRKWGAQRTFVHSLLAHVRVMMRYGPANKVTPGLGKPRDSYRGAIFKPLRAYQGIIFYCIGFSVEMTTEPLFLNPIIFVVLQKVSIMFLLGMFLLAGLRCARACART